MDKKERNFRFDLHDLKEKKKQKFNFQCVGMTGSTTEPSSSKEDIEGNSLLTGSSAGKSESVPEKVTHRSSFFKSPGTDQADVKSINFAFKKPLTEQLFKTPTPRSVNPSYMGKNVVNEETRRANNQRCVDAPKVMTSSAQNLYKRASPLLEDIDQDSHSVQSTSTAITDGMMRQFEVSIRAVERHYTDINTDLSRKLEAEKATNCGLMAKTELLKSTVNHQTDILSLLEKESKTFEKR
jgi:hypothetical protein